MLICNNYIILASIFFYIIMYLYSTSMSTIRGLVTSVVVNYVCYGYNGYVCYASGSTCIAQVVVVLF